MSSSHSPVLGVLLIVALVTTSRLVRRGRLQSRTAQLEQGQRIRPLAITLLDPLFSVVIIGPYLWRLITHSSTHVAVAVVGALLGVLIGYARARVMFVRAIRPTTSVVLRRSGFEYALLALLIVLRSAESTIERSSSTLASLGVTLLAALALSEAISRSGFIVKRYLDSPSAAEPDPSLSDPL
ncbi:MAG: hypothetical protein KGL23_08275 [Acidobacteriota bacterium]|nr:hypothetical protein [Acidobacteriota bacterium]MDE3031261.1 hypothetical protein [Acidobacteriota bacterium]MDE3093946.1 hypothetical protein [Acidobacteriota bacterium]MDE3140059.1 hypothetical protein [Acidobacteriota bacterium]MDE3147413.1 hypothetical protein [Acidobacteriota bacterium]